MAKAAKKKVTKKKAKTKKKASSARKKTAKKAKKKVTASQNKRAPLAGKSTHMTKQKVKRKWFIVDVTDQSIGRVATHIADVLRGKRHAYFTPNEDCGDFVIVVNASKIKFTGNKSLGKKFYHHTGYMGHLRQITAEKLMEKKPERVVESAVKGMLPHTRLGRAQLKKLYVYAGPQHPHQANKPEPLKH